MLPDLLGRPLALALVVLGGVATLRLARAGGAYRAGPWPGLTPRGAGVLLACAALLGGLQLRLDQGHARRAWPDVAVLAVAAIVPLLLALRVVRAPGTASAVCGAYLLPRSLLSLADPSLQPPALLGVAAVAFDLGAWLEPADLAALADAWPGRSPWRRRRRRPTGAQWPSYIPPTPPAPAAAHTPHARRTPPAAFDVARHVAAFDAPDASSILEAPAPAPVPRAWRVSLAGALFGAVLGLVEPPFAVWLGGDPAAWGGRDVLWSTLSGAAACAALGLLSARGTGPSRPVAPR